MDGKLLNHETIRTTNVFIAAYIFIFAASFFLISLNGFDMVTNFTAVAATLNNIGPGLEMAGPMQNFGCFADPQSWCLSSICWQAVWRSSPCWCCLCRIHGGDSKPFWGTDKHKNIISEHWSLYGRSGVLL